MTINKLSHPVILFTIPLMGLLFKSDIGPACETANEKPLDAVMDEISDLLEEAWSLPEHQRKQVIKRLILKWHPDKNKGQVLSSWLP